MLIKFNNFLIINQVIKNFLASYWLSEHIRLMYSENYHTIEIVFYNKNIFSYIKIEINQKIFHIYKNDGSFIIFVTDYSKTNQDFINVLRKHNNILFSKYGTVNKCPLKTPIP